MKFSNIILAFALIALVSCKNKKQENDHGHPHAEGEATHSHEHDESHQQESFVVDSNSTKSHEESHHSHDDNTHAHDDGSVHENHTDTHGDSYSDLAVLTVNKISFGKDGYTAELSNDEGVTFRMTVSIPNLEDKYKKLNVGDKVKVKGDYEGENPTVITPESIMVIEQNKE
ncbi:hypothetical protein [Leptobacterium flavescens]|uniref:hypothetical protein n=1 Tax=Leptobacterium flavescens TaxID=472055 RepID=UPI001954E5F4|nr:hypothetical protein [Leptobacterium flavescens]